MCQPAVASAGGHFTSLDFRKRSDGSLTLKTPARKLLVGKKISETLFAHSVSFGGVVSLRITSVTNWAIKFNHFTKLISPSVGVAAASP